MNEPETPLIVVDSQYLGRVAQYSTGALRHKGAATGVVYGFLLQVLQIAMTCRSTRFVFCWDSPKSKRKDMFPEYKRKRHTKPMTDDERRAEFETKAQFKRLRREILPALGFRNVWRASGYEADDLMAHVCQLALGPVVLVTADQDLYQCLFPNVSIYGKGGQLFTARHFHKKYGIPFTQWRAVKIMGGCATDEVPPVLDGIRETTVVSAFRKFANKEKLNKRETAVIDTWGASMGGTAEAYTKIKRNAKLVVLPFGGAKFKGKREIDPTPFTSASFVAFKKVCRANGMQSFLQNDMRKNWKAFFSSRLPKLAKSTAVPMGTDAGEFRASLAKKKVRLSL